MAIVADKTLYGSMNNTKIIRKNIIIVFRSLRENFKLVWLPYLVLFGPYFTKF